MGMALAAIVLAAAAPQSGSPEAAVAAIYAPYSGLVDATPPWEYPIFTRQTAALIAKWRTVTPIDEPDALSDGDWLCLCQEFDRAAFKVRVLAKRASRTNTVMMLELDLGHNTRRTAQLVLKREEGGWKLDDLYASPDFPAGLRQKLQEVILEESIP